MKKIAGKDMRRVISLGKSLAITIPKEYVDAHKVKRGDTMEVFYDEALHIERPSKKEILKKTEGE